LSLATGRDLSSGSSVSRRRVVGCAVDVVEARSALHAMRWRGQLTGRVRRRDHGKDRSSSQRPRRRRSAVTVLVDEMHPATVAGALEAAGIEATTVADLRLAGASDPEVFGAAVAGGYAVLTENVGDFAPLAAAHSTAGRHHHGVLIALSSRFSRRPAGSGPLVAAIQALTGEQIADRVVSLAQAVPR